MLFSRSEGAEFKRRGKSKTSIAAHPLFVPALTLWGAAVAGLAVFVLPEATIQNITAASALGVLGGFARLFFAALAAAIGAALFYFVGNTISRKLPGRSGTVVNRASAAVRPIDPASELGSESLDSPIEDEPFSQEPMALDEEDALIDEDYADTFDLPEELDWVEEEGGDFEEDASADIPDLVNEEIEPSSGPAIAPEPEYVADIVADVSYDEPAVPEPKSRAARAFSRAKRPEGKKIELVQALNGHLARMAAESNAKTKTSASSNDDLDLGAFDQIGDEVQLPTSSAAHAPKVRDGHPRMETAVEKLRSVPPQDLSLVQMVERFALALQDHKKASTANPQSEQTQERDAALAEALKALSKFTEHGFNAVGGNENTADADGSQNPHESQIRDAMGKLQGLRGAA